MSQPNPESRQFATPAELLSSVLELSKVKADERVVLLANNHVPDERIRPFEEAVRRVGSEVQFVRFYSDRVGVKYDMSSLLIDTLSKADFVLQVRELAGMPEFPPITAHATGLSEVLASGTRWLDVRISEANMRRLYPQPHTVQLALEGVAAIAAAKELRVTSEFGTDLVMRKDGRKGHRQLGISNDKGAWDNFGFAMAACGPLEDSANGVVVLQPGDGMLQMGGIVRDRTELHIENGKIVRIEGGETARAMQQWFAGWGDPESYGVSHIGWGLHPNAVWTGHPRFTVVDGESYRGSILIAFGSNAMDTPAPHSGMGGTRHCVSHLDVPLLNHSFAVDGVDTVRNGVVV